jgi:hypothetical protein
MHSGPHRRGKDDPVAFMQVNGYLALAGHGGEFCKTVGSAHVGSNPTSATSFRRPKPVTLVRHRLLRARGAVQTVGW